MPFTSIQALRDYLLSEFAKSPLSVAPLIETLRNNTGEGLPVDPQTEPLEFQTWGELFGVLLKNNLLHQASEIVEAWYDSLNELQIKNNKRYHKGGASHNIGHCALRLGNNAAGVWFTMCAFVEDVLSTGGNDIPQTPATQSLRVAFNWSDAEFESVASTARKSGALGDNLSWFPETTLVQLAREDKLNIPLARGSSYISINRTFLKQLITRLPNGDDNAKKQSLEFLASYLASTLPGVRIKANVKTFEHGVTFEHEIDLVATQYTATPTYLLEALGRHFLIECKNWDHPVGVRDLNHFVAKMRFHRCSCGVIFSREGLSGDKHAETGLRYARVTQLRWYQQDNCVVIVITNKDLNALATGSRTFEDILLRGYEAVRFSNSKDISPRNGKCYRTNAFHFEEPHQRSELKPTMN
jgi:hypothetical protein